jgi:hypothetical protein
VGFALRAIPLSFIADDANCWRGRLTRTQWPADCGIIWRSSPATVARQVLIRDEVSVIVVQKFVAERFEQVGHGTLLGKRRASRAFFQGDGLNRLR